MKALLLLACMLLVLGCHVFDPNLPRPAREYDHGDDDTIAVTVGSGFRMPGVHHVKRGTTVREFLLIARMLADPHIGAEGGQWSLFVGQMLEGKITGFMSKCMPTLEELDTVLQDRALVKVIKWNS